MHDVHAATDTACPGYYCILYMVCSLVFLVIGMLVGTLCGHWTTVYRLSKQRNLRQPMVNPTVPVPVYEELEFLPKEKDIELRIILLIEIDKPSFHIKYL